MHPCLSAEFPLFSYNNGVVMTSCRELDSSRSALSATSAFAIATAGANEGTPTKEKYRRMSLASAGEGQPQQRGRGDPAWGAREGLGQAMSTQAMSTPGSKARDPERRPCHTSQGPVPKGRGWPWAALWQQRVLMLVVQQARPLGVWGQGGSAAQLPPVLLLALRSSLASELGWGISSGLLFAGPQLLISHVSARGYPQLHLRGGLGSHAPPHLCLPGWGEGGTSRRMWGQSV